MTQMRKFSITYDLRTPGKDYPNLIEAIKRLGGIRPTASQWLVRGDWTATAVRDHLRQHIDLNDVMVVTELGADWASWNLSKETVDWLNRTTVSSN